MTLSTHGRAAGCAEQVNGAGHIYDDMTLPDMLYGALLQSPYAHAKIRNIDTSKATRIPGVRAVVTAKEAGLIKYGVSPARYDETGFRPTTKVEGLVGMRLRRSPHWTLRRPWRPCL